MNTPVRPVTFFGLGFLEAESFENIRLRNGGVAGDKTVHVQLTIIMNSGPQGHLFCTTGMFHKKMKNVSL